jgi:putative RecB family exonuclease
MPAELSVRLAAPPSSPKSLSPTSASTWAQCELKYVLAYLAGWQEPSTMPQLIGNVVHKAVELLYGRDRVDRTRPVASELLLEALAAELEKATYASLLAAGDPTAEVLTAGEDALDGLFELENPSQVTVGGDGLEVWVEAELYGAPIRGRIDRIYDASGAEVVADYKTGKVASPRFVQKAFSGLWTYAAALAASDPEHRLADRIELLYLAARERLSRPVLRDVALEQAKTLARTWRAIGAVVGSDVPEVTARKSKLCDWCAFKPACPAQQRQLPAVGTPGHDELLAGLGLTRRTPRDVAVTLERLEAPADLDDSEGAA